MVVLKLYVVLLVEIGSVTVVGNNVDLVVVETDFRSLVFIDSVVGAVVRSSVD